MNELGFGRLLSGRLSVALLRFPARRHWLELAILTGAFAAVAVPLSLRAGLIEPPWRAGFPTVSLGLGLRVLLLPALAEEILFRVLPNPHPRERPRRGHRLGAAFWSLAAYLAAHPLLALVDPARQPLFLSPVFLLLTALLGAACLAAYLRSGSLWPPVTLHWLVVMVWLGLGGEQLLRPAGG